MNSVARPNAFHWDQAPNVSIQRSIFDRSHGHKTTFNSDYLIPVYVDEVLPGDTFNLSMTAFCRMATPLYPVMDNAYFESFFFFVPCRLLWTHWVNFMGEQANPTDTISYTVPIVQQTTQANANTIQDYMGLPVGLDGAGATRAHVNYNALPLRAYARIWDEWFRDENLQTSVALDMSDGPDVTAYQLLVRGRRHDYFTSCLPWPQKWSAVNVLLQNSAIVTSNSGADAYGRDQVALQARANASNPGGMNLVNSGAAILWGGTSTASTPATWPIGTDSIYNYADLTLANPTIDQLHQSIQIQRMYQRDARGGSRYTELVRSHFGVVSPDARLQRSELLGAGRQAINVHPVAQTSATGVAGTTTHLGDLAAFGVSSGSRHGFTKSFTEHGYLIGLINVRGDQTYQQGLHKMWSRQTRFDFYFPSFAHIGEQAVLNQEIYYVDNSTGGAQNAAVFGYQERHADYRFKPSFVTGEFRSNYSTPLDSWHYAYEFSGLPVLNSTFISAAMPIGRTLAVSGGPDFLCDMWFNLKCARPMPVRSVPGILGRL